MLQVACGGKMQVGTYRVKCSTMYKYYLNCTTGLKDDLKYRSFNFFSHHNGGLVHGERSYRKFDVDGVLIPEGSVAAALPKVVTFDRGYGEFSPAIGGNCLLMSSKLAQLRFTFDQVITASCYGRHQDSVQTIAMLILPAVSTNGRTGEAIIVAKRSTVVPWDRREDIVSIAKQQADIVRYSLAEADAIMTFDATKSHSYYPLSLSYSYFSQPEREPLINLDWLGLLDQYEPKFTSYDEEALLGELSQSIADDVRPYRTNIFASLSDLPSSNPFNTLSQVVRTAGVAPLKAASDVALESQYGFNLTVQDAQAFAKALLRARDLSRVYRSSRSVSYQSMWGTKTSVFHAKAKVRRESSKVINIIDDLYSVGVMPTLAGAWDLIPFSFVADWFLPISDMLEQLDAGPELASLPLEYILLSEDKVLSLDDEAVLRLTRCRGRVSIHRYKRWIQSTLPPVRPHFTGLQEPHPNWVAAAALLVRRKS